jgi:signal transduction histidine kinase
VTLRAAAARPARLALLALLGLLGLPGGAASAWAQLPVVTGEGAPLRVIDKAEFVLDPGFTAPPDSAAWKPVSLPDDWHLTRPGTKGVGWYRVTLPVSAPRRLAYNILLPRNSATHIAFFANGNLIGGTAGLPGAGARQVQEPALYGIPPVLIRPGENRLYIRVVADAKFRQGLTRVTVGEPGELREAQINRVRLQVLPYRLFGLLALFVGLAALAIWLRRRDDATLFWFATAAALTSIPVVAVILGGLRQQGVGAEALGLFAMHAFSPALAVASLRAAGLRKPWFEWGLWIALAAGTAAPFALGAGTAPRITGALTVLFFVALTATLALLVLRASRRNRATAATLALSHLAAIAFGLHDWAHWEGWIDFDGISLFQFAPPVLMFGLGALLVSRHFQAADELAALNRELESRVAERSAEIERKHEQIRALETGQAAVRERQRIMADVHDGLGASLVSLLSLVQSGKVDAREIEQRLHQTLQELRLALDSMDTPEGDLLTALGTVRHRLRDPLDAAGIALDWRVGALPSIESLTPSRILSVQRIVLEAITNAVRHAGAKRIAVSARVDEPAAEVELAVEDDGRGFESGQQGSGRGLMIMQRRAAAVGGRLQIDARPGNGTRVSLRLGLA